MARLPDRRQMCSKFGQVTTHRVHVSKDGQGRVIGIWKRSDTAYPRWAVREGVYPPLGHTALWKWERFLRFVDPVGSGRQFFGGGTLFRGGGSIPNSNGRGYDVVQSVDPAIECTLYSFRRLQVVKVGHHFNGCFCCFAFGAPLLGFGADCICLPRELRLRQRFLIGSASACENGEDDDRDCALRRRRTLGRPVTLAGGPTFRAGSTWTLVTCGRCVFRAFVCL